MLGCAVLPKATRPSLCRINRNISARWAAPSLGGSSKSLCNLGNFRLRSRRRLTIASRATCQNIANSEGRRTLVPEFMHHMGGGLQPLHGMTSKGVRGPWCPKRHHGSAHIGPIRGDLETAWSWLFPNVREGGQDHAAQALSASEQA